MPVSHRDSSFLPSELRDVAWPGPGAGAAGVGAAEAGSVRTAVLGGCALLLGLAAVVWVGPMESALPGVAGMPQGTRAPVPAVLAGAVPLASAVPLVPAAAPVQPAADAPVSAVDLGLPFPPQAVQDPARSTRSGASGAGSLLGTQLQAPGRVAAMLGFYQQALQARWPAARIELQAPADGRAGRLTASTGAPAQRWTVQVQALGPDRVAVHLTRWQAE